MRFSLVILYLLILTETKAIPLTGLSLNNVTKATESIPVKSISLDYNLNEATVSGFISSSKDVYKVQLGAFRIRSNAETFCEKVREFIDNEALIIFENGFFKVKIKGSTESHGRIPGKPYDSNSIIIPVIPDTVNSRDNVVKLSVLSDSAMTGPDRDSISAETEKPNEAGSNIFFMQGDSPWLKRINYFGKSLTFVNALIISIVSSIGSMLILLVIILLNRRRLEKEAKLHQYLLEKYQGLIIDYLFGNTTPDDFRPIASDTYRRQVLIDQMIDVSINLKGEEAKKLFSLYKHLGLDRDSIIRANDYRWHKKIKGFRELAFMNIKDANDAIYKALNSSNEILRMEAQTALVRLGDENPFEFLSHLTRPFSLWEQITLHELIIQHSIPVPSFKKWLSSPNHTVILFALRMIREFRQTDAEDDVREVLLHPDPSVRQLAVQVAGDMEMRSTLEVMKRMFKNQEYNICLEIVKSMGKMPDLSMLGFLKLVLDKEDDVQLQIEATKAIENNGEEGVKALVKLMKSEYKNYNIIVRHVLDRRIF